MDSGLYIAVFALAEGAEVAVGKLGAVQFRRGVYFYVGSAQRNLEARVARHRRREKVLRWHIDYLSVRAEMLGVMLMPGNRERECAVAREVGEMYELAAEGFGSSDCRCGGHLFYTAEF